MLASMMVRASLYNYRIGFLRVLVWGFRILDSVFVVLRNIDEGLQVYKGATLRNLKWVFKLRS